MRILIFGSGGREHSLAWKLAQGKSKCEIICAPGNPGMAALGRCEALASGDVAAATELALRVKPDLAIIGPEALAAAGLADRLRAIGVPVFGASARAARIESSKTFAKELMMRHNVPTAHYGSFTDKSAACAFLEQLEPPYVIKADGLAAGKGVVITSSRADAETAARAALDGKFGDRRVVIEEFLSGTEASFFVLADGNHALPLAGAQDYKRAMDADAGPNTGGMGAISPSPLLDKAMQEKVMSTIIKPVLTGLGECGSAFSGVLYAGLMLQNGQAKVVEFNARFGDPECQTIMLRMEEDILPYLLAAANGELNRCAKPHCRGASICVVMATKGYPGEYGSGSSIDGLDNAAAIEGVTIFHAGTGKRDGRLIANGGRVLNIVAKAADLGQARERAYSAIEHIDWPQGFCRRDIGACP